MSDWKNKTKEIIANIGVFKDQIIKTVNELKDRVDVLEGRVQTLAEALFDSEVVSPDEVVFGSVSSADVASDEEPGTDSKPSLHKKP